MGQAKSGWDVEGSVFRAVETLECELLGGARVSDRACQARRLSFRASTIRHITTINNLRRFIDGGNILFRLGVITWAA